ncbi:unnamed protein product, partial [Phaeothamnion confervicola]
MEFLLSLPPSFLSLDLLFLPPFGIAETVFFLRGLSTTKTVNTLWKFGMVGDVVTPDPPTAVVVTSILDPTTNSYKAINCVSGCTFTAGSTIQFDGSASTAAVGATIVSYKLNWGDGTGSPKGTVTTFTKTYSTPGVYRPGLVVVDSNGRNDTAAVNFNVR